MVVNAWQMLIFTAIWYGLTITTYGVWVPAGLFLPGMIIGCAVGSCYSSIIQTLLNNDLNEAYSPVTPVIVGAGAMLCSYTHLSYSLLIIMLETTSSINLFIPMLLGIMSSKAVTDLLSRSLYERALRSKQMPVLAEMPPKQTINKCAKKAMVRDVVTIPTVANISEIRQCLGTSHQAFPVINTADNMIGLIPRLMLVRLVENQKFYTRSA